MSDDEDKVKDDNHPIKEVIKRLGEPATQLGQPTLSRLGTALGALTEAGLYKIGISKVFEYNVRQNAELKKNLERMAIEFSDEEPVVTIPVEIAQPVMERLSHVADPNIADLFVKLLSTAGHANTAADAHPSFIYVIDQLTPDEALMLSALGGVSSLEFIQFGIRDSRPEASGATVIQSYYYSRLYEVEGLIYPANCELYMENMISLGIFKVQEGWFVGVPNDEGKNVPGAEYERLCAIATKKVGNINPPLQFYSKNGILHPTNKGVSFITAVTG